MQFQTDLLQVIRFMVVLMFVTTTIKTFASPDSEVESRRADSFHLLTLSKYADKAIESWLKDHKNYEEDISVRRYYYGDIDGDGTNDLLLVTSLSQAEGNWWSIDFVLIRAAAPSSPVIIKFGGVGNRSYDNITMDSIGIHVDALYYGKSDPDCCPTIKKEINFVWKNGKLIEEH